MIDIDLRYDGIACAYFPWVCAFGALLYPFCLWCLPTAVHERRRRRPWVYFSAEYHLIWELVLPRFP